MQLKRRYIFLACLSCCLSTTLRLFFTVLVPTSRTTHSNQNIWADKTKLNSVPYSFYPNPFVLRATASLKTRYATDQKVIKTARHSPPLNSDKTSQPLTLSLCHALQNHRAHSTEGYDAGETKPAALRQRSKPGWCGQEAADQQLSLGLGWDELALPPSLTNSGAPPPSEADFADKAPAVPAKLWQILFDLYIIFF